MVSISVFAVAHLCHRTPDVSRRSSARINAETSGGIAIWTRLIVKQIMNSSAHTVKSHSRFMAMRTVSIAAMSVMWQTDLGVDCMTKEQFHNEKMYQSTMIIARKLLEQGAMTRNEYDEIDTIFTEKYHPSLGTLFCDLGLIYIGSRANM